ncbi:hypothetical protein Trydic_g17260 [Trypoxylus dichotomus]
MRPVCDSTKLPERKTTESVTLSEDEFGDEHGENVKASKKILAASPIFREPCFSKKPRLLSEKDLNDFEDYLELSRIESVKNRDDPKSVTYTTVTKAQKNSPEPAKDRAEKSIEKKRSQARGNRRLPRRRSLRSSWNWPSQSFHQERTAPRSLRITTWNAQRISNIALISEIETRLEIEDRKLPHLQDRPHRPVRGRMRYLSKQVPRILAVPPPCQQFRGVCDCDPEGRQRYE